MTTETTTTAAVARRDTGPGAMVKQYGADFTAVLPTHVKPEQWIRLAQGALRKGRKQGQRFELEIAAANNPGVFLAALLDAARLGLEPGTEQFYLTPRKVKGQLEILGIVGYQGIIELMYRAGAISSVVAECVYEHDQFAFRPGQDDIPLHEIDWDSEDRGKLRLVYAFARMKDGATSKVVVLNRQAIDRIKAKSLGSDSQYSPWQTDEAAMWLKSAVRQLAKWVPTSAEFMRAQRDAEPRTMPVPTMPNGMPVKDVTELTTVDEVLDGEIVDPADEQVAYEAQVAAQ
jgi:recombination protein RecT